MVVKSRDLRPGDVVFIEKGQQFPADLIILSSSQEDGLCYIETAELDGETNLKKRQALPETNEFNKREVTTPPPPDEIYFPFLNFFFQFFLVLQDLQGLGGVRPS